MTEKKGHSNRLIHEKSPYLLQHAYNPVDWFSWGEEAFEKAKKEDKPIFLSIGYSTCYWCHVMEREIFENKEISEEMNRIFVNIKVDREERPDVDRVYMTALQSMTGSGGWPMSMFLTNDLKPFYGATYVPPTSKYGLPGFEDLIHQLEKAWKTRRDEINKSGDKIINFIKEASETEKYTGELTDELLLKGSDQFKNTFDEEYGGFGEAPKFPRPPGLNFLLRMYHRFQDGDSLKMLVRTLLQMAKGGMYDHIGGGFHRYSVDRFWRVPHFEKMLYDQAQLVMVYFEAFQLTGDVYFAEIAKEVLNYVSEKLTDKSGGFYSAEDAESVVKNPINMVDALQNEALHKEEGAFYVWEKKELDELLGEDAEIFNYFYGVWEGGNAPAGSDPHSVFTDKNILYAAHTLSETSNKFEKSTDEVDAILKESREKLYRQREKRPRPHLDDKILTSWNALMISAYSKAHQVIGETAYIDSAKRSADFIIEHLYNDSSKSLLHRYRDEEAKFDGNLEDYTFFTQALIDLYESCFDDKYLDLAINLMETAINEFYDSEYGGFYDTTGKDASILVRTKEDYDSAEPTGNSIALLNLLRLSY
ncbi:MAG TPA: thioredoxin domain-containing protein, partial [Ignavibacteria bacterium]